MAINQARQYGRIRKIDHIAARRNLDISRRRDTLDPLSFDDDHFVFSNVVAGGVKQSAGENVTDLGGAGPGPTRRMK